MCQTREPESSSDDDERESEETNSYDEENHDIIRAKWIFDNAETLDQVIERLQAEIEHIRQLKAAGWELTGPVEDDYGHIRKTTQ